MPTVCRCENRKIAECPVNKLFRPARPYLTTGAPTRRHSRHPMSPCVTPFWFLGRSHAARDFPSVAGFFVHRGACPIRSPRQARADLTAGTASHILASRFPQSPTTHNFGARRLAQPSRDLIEKVSFVPINGKRSFKNDRYSCCFVGMDGRERTPRTTRNPNRVRVPL